MGRRLCRRLLSHLADRQSAERAARAGDAPELAISRSVGRIALELYPFGAGAMAVNVYLASLLGSWVGLPVLTPVTSLIVGCVIAVPVTWLFARYVKRLIDEADGAPAQRRR